MKFLGKLLLVVVVVIALLVAIVYGGVFLGHKVIFKEPSSSTPTIQAASDGNLTLGLQPNPPDNIDDYTTLLAEQLKQYNKVAPSLWPNNAVVNQSIILEEIESKRFWLIAPNGTKSELPENEALAYGFTRNAYFGGFDRFDGGMYLAVAESDLSNYLLFEKYLHLGTYDAFITFAHEGFHMTEQSRWPMMESVPNEARDEFLDNTQARAKRALLQEQLLKAIVGQGDKQLILEALATYEDYKVQFPEDYRNSIFTDRDEGTAYYYELIASLYSAYPNPVKDTDSLYRALSLLATREDI
jgi:hypothetical protein